MPRLAAALPRLAALVTTLFLALSLPAAAQDMQVPDYDAWNKLADQAEKILQSDSANDKRLQTIRDSVVGWRERLNHAQGINATRIATLKDQISALGPAPAEGASESEDIAARRKQLGEQLSTLQAPGLQAVEAYGRADGIVTQIDQTIRQRQAHALIRKTAVPLNPTNWGPAMVEAANVGRQVYNEARARWDDIGGLTGFTERLPLVGGFLLVALLLLTRGRHWIDSLPSRLSARASERSRAALVFGVSLGQIAIPLIGVMLAAATLVVTDLFDDWGLPLLRSVPGAGLSFFGGIWLARRLFPEDGIAGELPLPLNEAQRRQSRVRAKLLALALALHQLIGRSVLPLSGFNSDNDVNTVPERLSDTSAGVWHFMLILFGAFCLFQLANLLRRLRPSDVSDAPDYRVRIVASLGAVGRLIAVATLAAAAAGYVTAANAVLWSSVMTLGLAGLLIVLQDFIGDLYAMAKGGDASARDALIPALMSFALVLASLPLFALIWGARPSDLAEAWTRTQQGFSLGGVTLSPLAILTFVLVFAIGYFLTNFIQGAFRISILPKTRLDSGGQNAVVSMIGYGGMALAALLAITAAGINLTSLAVVAGALSVGIGFGMQQVVSNFVSGIILLVERPIAVGDWIEVGGQQGVVKKMAVRATQIQTFDRTDVIVPNSNLITQPVTNWTRGSLQGRIIVPVTVSHGADSRQVAQILREIAEDQPTVLVNPAPAVLLRSIGIDGMVFELRAILADINGGTGVISEINHQILSRFAEAAIILPGTTRPSRDIFLHKEGDVPGTEALALPVVAMLAGDDLPETEIAPQEAESHTGSEDGPSGQDGDRS
jgi:potassium efflux system protein